MDSLLLAFASFIGGMFVTSRMASWVALLVSSLSRPRSAEGVGQAGAAIAPLLLHSGPWALAITVAGVYYVATRSSSPLHLWAVVGGLALSPALVAGATAFAVWRHRRPKPEPQPLTPDRLLAIRSRFFRISSLAFAFGMPALLELLGTGVGREPVLLIITFFASFACGWLWSWFMWQWYGEILKMNEAARLQRVRKDEV